MVFGLATACKWRIIYTDDRLTDSPEYRMIFFKHSTLSDWMNKHPEFTIRRMFIMYEYPSLN